MKDNKSKMLIVPSKLGKWLMDNEDMIGDKALAFDMANELAIAYNAHIFNDETSKFIKDNTLEIWEVISGTRKYKIEEEEFYALVKQNEDEEVYGSSHWGYDTKEDRLSVFRYTGYDDVKIKMTKREWNELSIDDSFADFSKSL